MGKWFKARNQNWKLGSSKEPLFAYVARSALRDFWACYLGRCPRLLHLRTFGADRGPQRQWMREAYDYLQAASIHQHARFQRFRTFQSSQQPHELKVTVTASVQPLTFQLAQIIP